MLRRLHADQPEGFAFTAANQAWAEAQITKYPEGRQASAIIPLLWRAQEQEGWLTRPAIEHVATTLGMAYIRALEVATFYFMFQLQPVGSVAHIQICGTLSCMICGAEDLVAVCRDKIAPAAHQLSADGRFSWEEVECLGACANAPMAQIGKDYYEDLTAEGLAALIDRMAAGEVPVPGPQNGRFAAEPASGLTSLSEYGDGRPAHNASAALAVGIGDTLHRIDGTEVPLLAPWQHGGANAAPAEGKSAEKSAGNAEKPVPAAKAKGAAPKSGEASASLTAKSGPVGNGPQVTTKTGAAPSPGAKSPSSAKSAKSAKTAPAATAPAAAAVGDVTERAPERLDAPRAGTADDLKRISGVGPKLETVLNELGFWHFSQIAAWGPQEVAWVDARLKFKGRIVRDDWIGQATEFAKQG